MRIGFLSSCAIGLAIALTLGDVSTVKAQQTDSTRRTSRTTTKTKQKRRTTSSKRIPISKEGGEVVQPTVNQDSIAAAERARQDSIAAAAERARQDSIARVEQMRRDSIAAAERRRQDSIAAVERARQDSIARADSIAAAERARISWMRKAGGFYFGIAAGASIPAGSITNARINNGGYNTGWNITVPVGYDFPKSILGFRLDGTFDQLNGKNFNSNFSAPNLDIWGLNLDARLRAPLGRTWSRFYLLGGGSWADYRGFFTDFTNPNAPTNKSSASHWGWNAGGGFNFNWGNMVGLFVESRYVWLDANVENGFPYQSAHWVPIVLGVTF
jgi:Outer membrane protein beta-barrel domain